MGRRFISSAMATLLTATQICVAGPQNPFTLPSDDAVRSAGTMQLKPPTTEPDTPEQRTEKGTFIRTEKGDRKGDIHNK